ncbi:MAG: hypothetical protein LRZ84_00080 [Desertifilum sp.]|nr:hypothetical protein [Desertifilum sp.]
MRRSFTVGLLVIGLSGIGQRPIQAREFMAQFSNPSEVRENFWVRARQLTQDQITLLSRIEEAIASPDPNQVRTARGQLVLHLSSVDRFLQSQYPLPNLLCAPTFRGPSGESDALEALVSTTSRLSPEQTQVYCNLYATTRELSPLLPQLDRRLGALTDITPLRPLPLGGEPPGVAAQSFGPLTPSAATAPTTPPSPPPIIGRPAKTAVSGYVPPPPPAIAPPADITARLQVAQQLTARAQGLFPVGTQFLNPRELRSPITPDADLQRIQQSPDYSRLLALPNTGIARIQPAEFFATSPGELRNRLIPTPAEQTPLVPLTPPVGQAAATQRTTPSMGLSTARLEAPLTPEVEPEGFAPRFAVQIVDGQFQIIPRQLNYGFMVGVGDVPIDRLNATLTPDVVNLSPQLRSFFLNYRPPAQLEALQVDRRRFITGKVGELGLTQSLQAQAPIVLNQTYVMRLIQFELPEILLTGQRIDPRDRRNLDRILNTPSSDLLVAFRPVSQGRDGTYTAIWRILAPFPDPQITNLEAYVLPRN